MNSSGLGHIPCFGGINGHKWTKSFIIEQWKSLIEWSSPLESLVVRVVELDTLNLEVRRESSSVVTRIQGVEDKLCGAVMSRNGPLRESACFFSSSSLTKTEKYRLPLSSLSPLCARSVPKSYGEECAVEGGREGSNQ